MIQLIEYIRRKTKINVSIIVPVYNVEEYLPVCIDSMMHQGELRLEIILVDDGSTDRSGAIADQYAQKDRRITVLHQANGGASAARNAGFELAQGEYIVFIDSDDWVKEDSLDELYREAVNHQADVVMGNLLYFRNNEVIDSHLNPIPQEILNSTLSGKECFIRLVQARAYPPMAVNYIYRRKYLKTIQARFEEGFMAEDELWTPVVLCQAEKMAVVDIDFYFYRQRESSVMHTTNPGRRLLSYFRVTDKLFEFANRFNFSGEDGELKNWFYVNIYWLYSIAFTFLSKIKDSSFIIPSHHLDRFWIDCCDMMPEPQKICSKYFRIAEAGLKKYIDWRTSDRVASIAPQITAGKTLILIYNTIQEEDIRMNVEDVPADWVITTDRRYIQQADAVVFHLPTLQQELGNNLDKPQGQIWINWYLESEKNNPWIEAPEIKAIFDLQMCYEQNEERKLAILCRKLIQLAS